MSNSCAKVPPKNIPDLSVLKKVPFFRPGWWWGPEQREKYKPIKRVNKAGVYYCVVGDHCWKQYKHHLQSWTRADISFLDIPEKICKLHEKRLKQQGEKAKI